MFWVCIIYHYRFPVSEILFFFLFTSFLDVQIVAASIRFFILVVGNITYALGANGLLEGIIVPSNFIIR
jgi:hypothetical protein